jgi:arylsulfatase A-like enzyme
MDKFASRGALFEDVMSPSPWTLPSHGSMLTGVYPNRHGLKSYESAMPREVRTLADVLKENGYLTAAVINSHCLSRRYGLNRGFDDFAYLREILDQKAPSGVGVEGIKRMETYGSKPFFLFLHLFDVHSDYSSLPYYEKQFVNPYKGNASGTTSQLIRFCLGKVKFDQAGISHLIDLYDASVRQMDDVIGDLLQCLKTTQLLEKSLVIITSDHGEEFMEHGGVLHSQTQYQEMLKVPLIICGPDIPKARRIKTVVSLVDIMPTILSYAGIKTSDSVDGLDVNCLLQTGSSRLPSRYVFSEANKPTGSDQRKELIDNRRAVRHPRYKLHYDKLTKNTQLYDLQNDPMEKANVLSGHKQLASSMFEQLKVFMQVDAAGTGEKLPPLSSEEVRKLKSLGYL